MSVRKNNGPFIKQTIYERLSFFKLLQFSSVIAFFLKKSLQYSKKSLQYYCNIPVLLLSSYKNISKMTTINVVSTISCITDLRWLHTVFREIL